MNKTVSENKRGKLILISGCAGSGKGTVRDILMEKSDKFIYSVSMTTRNPRIGEIDGVHYFFVTKEQFKETIDNDGFLEYAQFDGQFYGTPKAFFEEKIAEGYMVVLEIEIQGAEKVMSMIPPEDRITFFLSAPSYKVLEERLRGRNTETEDRIQNRLLTARSETLKSNLYDHIIINKTDRAADAAELIYDIIFSNEKKDIYNDLYEASFDNYLDYFFKSDN